MRVLILYHPGTGRPEKDAFGEFIGGCTSRCREKTIEFGVVKDVDEYANDHLRDPYEFVFSHLLAESRLADTFPGDATTRKTYTSNRQPLYNEVFRAIKESSQTGDPDTFIDSVITEFKKFLTDGSHETATDELTRFGRLLDSYSHSAILAEIFGDLKSHKAGYAAYLERNYGKTVFANRDYERDIIKYYASQVSTKRRSQEDIVRSGVIPIDDSDTGLGKENDDNGKSKLGIVGDSPWIKRLRITIRRICQAKTSALILGEIGTGKEKVAEAFHLLELEKKVSSQKTPEIPFIPHVCTEIGDINLEKREYFGQVKNFPNKGDSEHTGLLEQANGGILFLDEIQNISRDVQTMLLRVIEPGKPPYVFKRIGSISSSKTDARFLFATSEKCDALVVKEVLLDAFANRIFQNEIKVPPLRERRLDIPILVKYLCAKTDNRVIQGFTSAAMIVLMAYGWDDDQCENVRGLRKVIAELNTKGVKYIDVCHLPQYIYSSSIAPASAKTDQFASSQENFVTHTGKLVDSPAPSQGVAIPSEPDSPADWQYLQIKALCEEYNFCLREGKGCPGGVKIFNDKHPERKPIGHSNFRKLVVNLKQNILDKYQATLDEKYKKLLTTYSFIDQYSLSQTCPQKTPKKYRKK